MMTKKERALVSRIRRAYPSADPEHPPTDAAILKTARHWIRNGQKKPSPQKYTTGEKGGRGETEIRKYTSESQKTPPQD